MCFVKISTDSLSVDVLPFCLMFFPENHGSVAISYLRATAHAADPSNSEEEVKEEAMHG